jgi:hypothetical protein
MALQLHHRVVVIGFQRQVAVLGITFEEPSFLQESRYTMTDGMHQRFEFIEAWRFYPVKTNIWRPWACVLYVIDGLSCIMGREPPDAEPLVRWCGEG